MEYRWTDRDMVEFQEKYPSAYAFLLNRSLFNEYRHLETNDIILNDWQKNRLDELRKLFKYTEIARANVDDMLFDNKKYG
jgi:hypothetical protein